MHIGTSNVETQLLLEAKEQ